MRDKLNRFCIKEVQFYSYRSARMYSTDTFLTLDRHSEEMKDLENELAEMAGVSPDNHTMYTVKLKESERELFIQFTDSSVNFGCAIIEGNW